MEKTEQIPKSIYLDWNIFQDVIQTRREGELLESLASAKRKGFITPYSYAHMSDLARCRNEDYVNSDLEHVEKITGSQYIEMDENHKNPVLVKVPPLKVLNFVRDKNSKVPKKERIEYSFSPYKVAIEKLSKDNLLVSYLNRFDGLMCPDLMAALMQDLQDRGLEDYELQRSFRNCFVELVEIGDPVNKSLFDNPYFKYLFSTKEEIEKHFLEIFSFHINALGVALETVSEHDKFTVGYGLLDFFPAFKEKISKRNNMNNMLTDALHVLIASRCRYFIGRDEKLIDKARLLYRVFDIPTKVYKVDEFILKVEL